METENKVAIGVGAALLMLGIPYLLSLKRLSEELETVTNASIQAVGPAGLRLKVEITLKNPTGGSLKVKHPFVRMIFQDTVFATSESRDTDYEVPRFGELDMDPVFIELTFVQLGSIVPGLLKEYRKTGKLQILARTVTTINNKVPYVKQDTINL